MKNDEVRADMREMHVVHTALRREYNLLPELVLGVNVGDAERAALVAEHIAFVNSILHRHHAGEDKHLWPRLLTRAAESLAPLVHTVERQHESIDKAMSELNSALTGWRPNPGPQNTVDVIDAIGFLLVRLEEHLQLEERELLPLIEEHITASEWNRMGDESGIDTPPEEGPLIFGMLMYEGDPGVLEDMIAHMPPEVASTLVEIAPAAYRDYCRKIHGTATP